MRTGQAKAESAGRHATKPTIRFTTKLFAPTAANSIGSSAFASLPKSANAGLPTPAVMVEGAINGFPFRAVLEPAEKGIRRLKVSKAIREAAGADVADSVTVEITRVGEEPEIRVPADLRNALEVAPRAGAMWAAITPNARRDWILWLITAKQSDTRRRRVEKACDMLASGKRRVCCFGGLNWLIKDRATSRETWVQLPTSQ